MFTRVLDDDPLTGVKETFHYDADTGRCTIASEVDITALVEENKAHFNSMRRGDRYKTAQNRVASVPGIVYARLMQEGRTRDQGDWRKWLNDTDNKCFRTRPGRI